MSIGTNAIKALRQGETLAGYFVPAGSPPEVPGFLHWSFADGAMLELIGDTQNWPRMGVSNFVVHGRLRDGGQLSLLDGWVKAQAVTNRVTAVHSSTLVLGDHVNTEMRWPRVLYSTANLSEWRRDTGLSSSRPAPRTRPDHFRVDWRPPTRNQATVPGGQLTFVGTREFAASYAADWHIATSQETLVNLETPLTIDEARRRFATPLLCLTSFASDRPDGIVQEVFTDSDGRRRFEVWREGQTIRPREWRATDGYLFHSDDLKDYARAIRTWC
jgi:hypothetical protein